MGREDCSIIVALFDYVDVESPLFTWIFRVLFDYPSTRNNTRRPVSINLPALQRRRTYAYIAYYDAKRCIGLSYFIPR